MRNIILIFAFVIIGCNNLLAQCSPVTNNFEIRLLPSAEQQLAIQIRHVNNLKENALSALPMHDIQLDGLIFAITWPVSSSSIKITDCKSFLKPFNIVIDNGITNASMRTANDNITTLYHSATMPEALGFDWQDGKWYEIAIINYSGKLAQHDFFSLINCDYGMANPNSYFGNSTTDPWLAFLTPNNDYLQYSPTMRTELSSLIEQNNVFKIYPNPTSDDLNIDIESQINTQVAIHITDVTGKIVKSIVYKLEKGTNNTVINMRDLAQGNYFVKITDGKTIQYTSKISKL